MTTKIHKSTLTEILAQIKAIDTDTLIIIADQRLWELYRNELPLDKIEGKKIILRTTPSGEAVKNFEEFASCSEYLLDKGVHRKAHLIAFGGGSLSDFAGFVASTLLRGISWSIIPTTLLSMVDASIGGKTAINSKVGKNLIGAFHKPENVWLNVDFLNTLPEEELVNGYGEVIKYAFLNEEISNHLKIKKFDLNELIFKCAEYKLDLTEKDFKESGLRKCLNLGHTLGHAIEKIYSLPHGEAVFWGIALVLEVFQNGDFKSELKEYAKQLGVHERPVPWYKKTFPIEKIMTFISKDKKMLSKTNLEFVLVEKIGKIKYQAVELTELESKLEAMKDTLSDYSL
ncbi:MAG: 3-dehydroquinate synthase [Halobacteriovorax sp.]|nr:3-dehydroquinate synthase [Halobacteriovorax sp.]|tara:strand:- start:108722 stop:109750 length:1029 start_codon:yes stop_codon:yes gene_type:complete